MGSRFYLPLEATLLIFLAGAMTFSIILLNSWQPTLAAVPAHPHPDFDIAEAAMIPRADIEPEVLDYLTDKFCADNLCPSGSWTEWIILDDDSNWEIADLQLLHTSLIVTKNALDDEGFDGYSLLSGYRFRHSRGIYLPGELGILARVMHERQEIVLADGALMKQWGFYIYHEFGHVTDRRLEHSLTDEFQLLTQGEQNHRKTADGYWLNSFARKRPEEATADAFALWIVLNHTTNPRPVFWMKPQEAHYEAIAGVINSALQRIAARRR